MYIFSIRFLFYFNLYLYLEERDHVVYKILVIYWNKQIRYKLTGSDQLRANSITWVNIEDNKKKEARVVSLIKTLSAAPYSTVPLPKVMTI